MKVLKASERIKDINHATESSKMYYILDALTKTTKKKECNTPVRGLGPRSRFMICKTMFGNWKKKNRPFEQTWNWKMKMKITQENKRKRSPTTIVLFFLKVHQTTQPTVGVSTPHLRSLQLSRALVVDWKMKEGDEMLMLVVGRVLMHRLGQFNKTEMQG